MLDPDVPIPLILEQLRGNNAWALMCDRLTVLIEKRVIWLTSVPADTDPREIQRAVGEIKAFRLILKEPERLQKEWLAAHKQSTTMGTR